MFIYLMDASYFRPMHQKVVLFDYDASYALLFKGVLDASMLMTYAYTSCMGNTLPNKIHWMFKTLKAH